jgi:hypothetical protein
MRNFIVFCMIWSMLFCSGTFAAEAQGVHSSPSSQSQRICDTDVLDRITYETVIVQYQNRPELDYNRMQAALKDEKNEENEKWMKRHPVLFGTLVGFGIGFSVGLASGGGSDVSAAGMGLYFGAIGAGAGALIGSVASK